MEKFSDIFKATVAVFHGIISTWLFLEFSETTVDQLQFLIILVFFTVCNVIVWGLILRAYYWARGVVAAVQLATNDIGALRYRAVDVAGLTVIAICLGLLSAYLHRHDVILSAANQVANWRRTHTDVPFILLLSNISARTMNRLDGRGPHVVKAAGGMAYLRVHVKDSKIAYEGFPRAAPNKRDPRELVLSPACRYAFAPDDPTRVATVQAVEGPGVFLRLADTAAFEIIDRNESKCAQIHDAINAKAGDNPVQRP